LQDITYTNDKYSMYSYNDSLLRTAIYSKVQCLSVFRLANLQITVCLPKSILERGKLVAQLMF